MENRDLCFIVLWQSHQCQIQKAMIIRNTKHRIVRNTHVKHYKPCFLSSDGAKKKLVLLVNAKSGVNNFPKCSLTTFNFKRLVSHDFANLTTMF